MRKPKIDVKECFEYWLSHMTLEELQYLKKKAMQIDIDQHQQDGIKPGLISDLFHNIVDSLIQSKEKAAS